MKKFYRFKGRYKDGRKRVEILDKDAKKSKTLPRPEELWVLLEGQGVQKEQRKKVGK